MLLEPPLTPKQDDKQTRTYQNKSLIGKALQIYDNFEQEHTWISTLVFASHQYNNKLKKTLKEPKNSELAVQSMQEFYWVQYKKNMAMKAQVEQQTAALLALFATSFTVIPLVTSLFNQQPADFGEVAA